MPDFAVTHAMTAATCKISSATHAILTLTWFCHLIMCLWILWGLEEPQGGPPYTWKNLQCLKLIFRPFGTKKKIESGKWPSLTSSPRKWNFPLFLTLPLLFNFQKKSVQQVRLMGVFSKKDFIFTLGLQKPQAKLSSLSCWHLPLPIESDSDLHLVSLGVLCLRSKIEKQHPWTWHQPWSLACKEHNQYC